MRDSNFKLAPRTMDEAFGPGSKLDTSEPRRLPGTALIPWIIVGAFAVLFAVSFYYRLFV